MIAEAAILITTVSSPTVGNTYESFPNQVISVPTCWVRAVEAAERLESKHHDIEIGVLCVPYTIYLRGDRLNFIK